MEEKNLGNENTADAKTNASDIKVTGNPDIWHLVCKASSQKQGWMKSTKVMAVDGYGVIIQVSTQQGKQIAEAITFVPGVGLDNFGIE